MKNLDQYDLEAVNGGIGFLGGLVYGLAGAAAFKALPGVGMGERNSGDPGANIGTPGA
jgi:lactobin A/cerein 7B family class IIb bacteriocin